MVVFSFVVKQSLSSLLSSQLISVLNVTIVPDKFFGNVHLLFSIIVPAAYIFHPLVFAVQSKVPPFSPLEHHYYLGHYERKKTVLLRMFLQNRPNLFHSHDIFQKQYFSSLCSYNHQYF